MKLVSKVLFCNFEILLSKLKLEFSSAEYSDAIDRGNKNILELKSMRSQFLNWFIFKMELGLHIPYINQLMKY